MKITVIVRILWNAGAPRIAINQTRELARQGHEVSLIFLRGDPYGHSYGPLLKGIDWKIARPHGSSLLTPLFYHVTKHFLPERGPESTVDLDLILKAWQLVEKTTDLVICHDQWAGLSGYTILKRLGIPYIVFIHEAGGRDFRKSPLTPGVLAVQSLVLSHAKRILAVTDKIAYALRAYYPKFAAKTFTAWPGVNLDASPMGFRNRSRRILTVAMWDQGRQPEKYLDLAKTVEDFEFLLAGTWRNIKAYQEISERLIREKLSGRVKLLGTVPEDSLTELYSRSMYFARFGFAEFGLGTSVLEAIEHLTPVIVNADLGTAELIARFGGGLVASPSDKAAITEFATNNASEVPYASLQRGLERIAKRMTWENHVRRILD